MQSFEHFIEFPRLDVLIRSDSNGTATYSARNPRHHEARFHPVSRFLKERDELDVIMPDLLSEIGMNVISRPARGTRQYGVDVAAVGTLPGSERSLYLLSIKPGNLGRSEWDTGKQSLRASLNEICDVYIEKHIPKRYKNLPVVVVLCIGGELHEDVQLNVNSYTDRQTTDRISFLVWNGDTLAGLLLSGILREHALPDTWRSDLRKAVAPCRRT